MEERGGKGMGEKKGTRKEGNEGERENEMKETDTVLWAQCDRVRDGLVRRH